MCKLKACSRCKEEKPLTSDYYNFRKDSVDGFRGQCINCLVELRQKKYKEVIAPRRREKSRVKKEEELALKRADFLSRLKTENKNDITALEPYVRTDEHIKVKFNECGHIRSMTPKKLMQGQGCGHKECMAKKLSETKLNTRRKTIKKEFNEIGYELLDEFKGINEDVRVQNNSCGHIYEANASNILHKGSGCPICHGMKDTDIFKQQVADKYGSEYTILSGYINNRTPIKTRHNECGHVWSPTPKSLLRERVCPQCNISKGEHYINELLESLEVDFERELIIDDCRHINPLPFDFAVNVNGELRLIEFDGSQHFGRSNYWGKDNYDSIRRNDRIKDAYCIENDIPLLRLPYWWLDTDRIDKEILNFIN